MDNTFVSSLNNPEAAIAFKYSSTSKTMLIAFGGIAGALGIPPFEFFNLTKNHDLNCIYVRDLYQAWYHKGLPGVADDIAGIAVFLKEEIKKSGAERVVLTGNSMGGYAAILIGALVNADEVQAFSPQTFIDVANRAHYGDNRFKSKLDAVHRLGESEFLDLSRVICAYSGQCKFNIHYSPESALDKVHAERLGRYGSVVLHSYGDGGHTLVKHLKNSGALADIIGNAIDPLYSLKLT